MADGSQNVPKEFVRTPDHELLPPRVGHNWNDQAFRKSQSKPQQLEGELRGKRAFVSNTTFHNPHPESLGDAAQQLLLALSAKNPRSLSGKGASRTGAIQKRFLSLDDKVLRFYAYFRERAPEGGVNEFWHRRVVINFYPADDTILIQEPTVPNSGMDGGTFLKRQKVKADPRQREQFPDDEYLTVNFFNVGEVVRINAVEFYLYDCDGFTRDFLSTVGVVVGEPIDCPDDEFMEAFKRHQNVLLGAKFGVKSQDYQAEGAERTARFIRDGGKILRFKGILDEREAVPGGVARKLELFVFVEDNSIAITETATVAEATPAMFLSRCFLPKSGNLNKVNELTFSHRVNGQREPDVGSDGIYKDVDLDVGITINVLGRPVFLYDCDEFTREFYQRRFGVELRPSMAAEVEGNYFTTASSTAPKRSAASTDRQASTKREQQQQQRRKPKDELRFRMVLSPKKGVDDHFRRFTLTYYTDTNEVTVYETGCSKRTAGGSGSCLVKRQELRKPVEPRGPRNDPKEKLRSDNDGPDVYHEEDFRIGNELVVCGAPMRIVAMDAHTEAYFTGVQTVAPSDATVQRLLGELFEFLGSRYGTAVKAFLAFDHDRDGIISLGEFVRSLKAFQITDDPGLAEELFAHITNAPYAAFYLTANDLMRWMSESAGVEPNGAAGVVPAGKDGIALTSSSYSSSAAATGLLGEDKATQQQTIAARGMRVRVLNELRERLEARKMDSVGMFRLASTMPRAYKERRADLHTLSNPDRDAQITPVQLRRCCEEILGTAFTQEEMACIVSFFFPEMPAEDQFRARDDNMDYTVALPAFQKRYHDMCRLVMIPDKQQPGGCATATAMKTSVI